MKARLLILILFTFSTVLLKDMNTLLMSENYYNIGNPVLTDIWVNPTDGNDSNSGVNRLQALATLREAWERIPSNCSLNTGYRIMLVEGNYSDDKLPSNGWMESRYGTYQFPVIIQSADGTGKAVLNGNLNIYDCRYLYLIGFKINAQSENVLHIASCNYILLHSIEAIGADADLYIVHEVLKCNQCQYIYVEDSDFSGAHGNAIDFVAVQYGHIKNNLIHNTNDWGMYLKGGSAYFVIEGNQIFDCWTGGFTAGQGTGFEFMSNPWLHYETYDIKFINNIVHDTYGAGMGVNGGYNILLAYNTLYRVGERSHIIEVVFGLRGCDGDTAKCSQYLLEGGWGTTNTDYEEPIPNCNVYIYNNIVYNPSGYQSRWQHFAIYGPRETSSGSNIPSPARTDTNLKIRGNIIWNGSASHPIGVESPEQGGQPNNSQCNLDQIKADNSINTIKPQLADPENGDFKPIKNSNVFNAVTYAIPNFSWNDLPPAPKPPQGNLSNSVLYDRSGAERSSQSPPGAYCAAATNSYYVALNGDDNNPGTMQAPWRNPDVCADRLQAGDSLIIRSGTYILGSYREGWNSWISPTSGTSNNWTTVRAQAGETVVITGQSHLYSIFNLNDKEYIKIEGLEIKALGTNGGVDAREGIEIGNGCHISLINLHIHDMLNEGININGAQDISVCGCTVENNGKGPSHYGSGIETAENSVTGLTVKISSFNNNTGDGIGIEEQGSNILIENCTANNNERDGFDSKAPDSTIKRCTAINNIYNQIKLWGDNSRIENCIAASTKEDRGLWDCVVLNGAPGTSYTMLNTTIYGSNNYAMIAGYDYPGTNAHYEVKNCIFLNNRGSAFFNGGVDEDYNVFYGSESGVELEINGEQFTADNINNKKAGLYDIAIDPLLESPQNGDFHLKLTSHAIDTGKTINGLTIDIEGNTRPNGNRYDIGAYEYTESGDTNYKWYLPEGCTAGFSEWVLIMNPSNQTNFIKVTFMKPDGSTIVNHITLSPTSRYTINVNNYVQNDSVSTMVESLDNIPIIVERSMYWNSGDIIWSGGHNTIGITSLGTEWYLAEGCTNGFSEWVLIMNPNNEKANITVTFIKPDGSTIEKQITVLPTSRYTINVNQYVPNNSVSTKVISDTPVAVERAMYWDSGGYNWIEGHVATGISTPSTEWYLAEGCTNGFSEWVLIMNPNTEPTPITVTFMKPDGTTLQRIITVNPTSRYTIHVNDYVPNNSVSTNLKSELPIVAERAMYWDSGNIHWAGGHISQGSPEPALTWYLAEGYTGSSFSTWILIMNPNNSDSNVKITFMKPDGSTIEKYFTITGTSRYTINVKNYIQDDSVSTKVESINNVPVIAERAMYWDSGNYSWKGGHASLGVKD